MNRRVRNWLTPTYIFLCLTLGGSSQGIWSNALLQLVGTGIIAYAWLHRPSTRMPKVERRFWWIAAATVAFMLVQLVPLPPAIWTALPGRALVAQGDQLLGVGPYWRPISLSPSDTLATILTLIPPIGVASSMLLLGSRSGRRIVLAVALAVIVGLLLAAMQLGGGAAWYPYQRSNIGVASGLFANGNHMASFLLCALPLGGALAEQASALIPDLQQRRTLRAASMALGAVAIAGLVLNGSLFGLAMAVPVTMASLLVAFRHSIGRRGRIALAAGALAIVIAGVGVALGSAAMNRSAEAGISIATRADMAHQSVKLIGDSFPVGTGAGTFEVVYQTVENPSVVNRFFVNHAHDDYLEWAVEGGLMGMLIVAAFVLWWVSALRRMVEDRRSTGYAQAGAIIAVVLMAHSALDFPLRTAALSAMFSLGLGLMLNARRLPRHRDDLRPSRHLSIG